MKKSFFFLSAQFLVLSLTAANMIPGDSSFETGFGIMPEQGQIVETDAPDGKCALQFGGSLISYNKFSLTPGKKYFFSVWLKSEKPVTVILRAYRTNWDGNFPTQTFKVGPAWERCTLHIPAQKFGGHNTFWLQLMVHDKNAEVLADALQLEEGDAPTQYQSSESVNMVCRVVSPIKGNLFFTNEQPRFLLTVRNNLKETVKRQLSVSVTDYFGKRILEKEEELQLAPGEKKILKFTPPESSKKGFFMIRCALTDGKETPLNQMASYCIITAPVPRDPAKRSLFGSTGMGYETIEADGRMGVKALAIAVRWAYQDKDGKINFENTDTSIDKMLQNGIEPVILLRRTPSWAAMKQHPHDVFPPRDEARAAYEEFAFQVVQHYKGKARIYQLWGGETDLQAQHQSQELGKSREWYAELIADLCKYGYKGIKKADPDAIVQTPSVSGVDCGGGHFTWQQKILALTKGFYDEVVIHPYCYPWYFEGDRYVQSPEESGLENVCRKISKLAEGKKMMNGEFGFEISSQEPLDSPASKRQADYMVRSFLLSAESGTVSTLLHATISTNRGTRSFSVFDWPNPRPGAAAYSTLAHLFTYASDPERFDMGSMVRGLIMESSRKTRIGALWVPENKQVPFQLDRDSSLTVFDIMGNPIEEKEILLSGTPVFFETGKTRAALKKQLLSGILHIQELTVEGRIQDLRTIRFYLKNQLLRTISGTLEVNVPLKEGGMKRFSVPFTELRPGILEHVDIRLDRDMGLPASNPIEGIAKTATSSRPFSISTDLKECPRLAKQPKIDGDLSEWAKRPALLLESIDFLSPPDAVSHGMWTGSADLSIKAWIGWDSDYFYFAAQVRDDIHIHKGDNVFDGDCVQLAFDTQNDALSRGYGRNDFEYNFALGPDRALYSRSWPLPPSIPEKIRFAARRDTGATNYEIAIPLKLLHPLPPVEGTVFGFNFVALDADLGSSIDYWMGYSYGICGGKDPAKFKKFILTKQP